MMSKYVGFDWPKPVLFGRQHNRGEQSSVPEL